MPVVLALKNPFLMKEHMEEIKEVVGKPDFDPNQGEGYTLENLINENIVQYQE